MKDAQGMPGTCRDLGLRIAQFAFALVSLSVMGSTNDFPSVTAFRHLVAAVGLQCLWSLLMALIDVYTILVRRSLRNCRIVSLFAVGDGITSTLTFAASCASAGITVLISNDLDRCALNHCTRFEYGHGFRQLVSRTHVISREFLVACCPSNIPRRKQNLHPHLVQWPLTLEKYVTTRLLAM